MKKNASKFLILVLTIAVAFNSLCLGAFAAEDYSCETYSECVEDGAEIYVITKNNCPIRREAHDKGEIVARAKEGQLISVSNIFWTKRLARWCEIQTDNGSLYVHIDNCAPHEHDFVSLLENSEGTIDFCPVCCATVARGSGKAASCNLACVVDQTVKGSFSDYDPSFNGVASQIIVGELPIVGQIADVRDLIGDIAAGEAGWVIGLDAAALIPVIGAIKYADEIGIVGKNVNKIDNVAKASKRIFWGKWSDYPKETINGTEYAKIGKHYYVRHAVDTFTPPSINTNQIGGVEYSRSIVPSYVEWMLDEGVKSGITTVSEPYLKNGAWRRAYENGTLKVIVEEGDIVVTIHPID